MFWKCFLAKTPINQNKVQYLVSDYIASSFIINNYKGAKEYPLVQPLANTSDLSPYFESGTIPPNVFVFMIEGLGSEFTQLNSPFSKLTPEITKIAHNALVFQQHYSPVFSSHESLRALTGILPKVGT